MKKLALITLLASAYSYQVAAETQATDGYWQYEMQPGESVWGIAHELLTDWRSWQRITRINGVANDRAMPPGTVIKIPVELVNQRASSIQIKSLSGSVLLSSAGSNVPLSGPRALVAGDALTTSDNASALVHFEDNTQLLLHPESRLLIKRASVIGNQRQVMDINVSLEDGEAEIRANPDKAPGSRFLIETPAVFATTRGTVYRVRADGNTTAAEVTQGRISLDNSAGSQSLVQNFGSITEKDQPPKPPVKLLPAPQFNAPTQPTQYLPSAVRWQPVAGASGYRVQLSSDEQFNNILQDSTRPGPSYSLPTKTQDGPHWLRVRAIDSQQLQGNSGSLALDIQARPFPPVNQSPYEGQAVYTGEIEFTWTKPEGDSRYLFELSESKDFSKPLQSRQMGSDLTTSVSIEQPGHYFWRVTSINDTRQGPPGHASAFEVRPKAAAPDLSEPEQTEEQLIFAWPAGEQISKYQAQLAKDKDFNNILQQVESSNPKALFERPASGDYFLRVRSFDSYDYPGDWSSTQQLYVPAKSYLPAGIWGILTVILIL